MANDQATRKWTELRGLAVVALENGAKVGNVDDFYFDPASNQVRGLKVKTGMFSSRSLHMSAITGIGLDAITTASEEALMHEKDNEDLGQLPLGNSMLTYKIMGESGTVVGNVGNMLLDISTPSDLHVEAFELASGLRAKISGHYPTFDAKRVLRYGQDVMVIPDALALELS